MKNTAAITLEDLFNRATIEQQINKKMNNEVPIDDRFFKPKDNSTPRNVSTPMTVANSTSVNGQFRTETTSPNSWINPTVANLLSQYANSYNNLNQATVNKKCLSNLPTSPIHMNSQFEHKQSTNNRMLCSTPIKNMCSGSPIKELCNNVSNLSNLPSGSNITDANLLETARNLSNYLSPTNCSNRLQPNRNFDSGFNLVQSNSNLYSSNRQRADSFGVSSNYNSNPFFSTFNSKLMNSCYSPTELLSPNDESFSFCKNWQDKRQMSFLYNSFSGLYLEQIYRQAESHRQAAKYNVAQCTWRGTLPTKNHKNPIYSTKVFLGGIPYEINEQALMAHFARFGNVKVVWPDRESRFANGNQSSKCGYVYIIFEHQERVKQLLNECSYDHKNGGKYFYRISTRRMPNKEVQVIPWIIADSNYVRNSSQRLDPKKTIFVGALHGMVTAEALARILDDLFGPVVYVGIDTDKQKYPLGTARASFYSTESYVRAIKAGFVEVKSNKFNKKIQCDPYLEPSNCSFCDIQTGSIFCRSLQCFRYFCVDCYYWFHSQYNRQNHIPMIRKKRDQQSRM